MISPNKHSERERFTVQTMIKMYCKKFHDHNSEFCVECSELLEYAEERLKYCQFGKDKPTCRKCPIHCYKPLMREMIQKVMRYSGPRMIYSHPLMGIRYLFKKFKHIEELD
ncbi:MAG: nitrous oxide-stimulated promoter family protein [Candidatus Thorarchaeota archaeon]